MGPEFQLLGTGCMNSYAEARTHRASRFWRNRYSINDAVVRLEAEGVSRVGFTLADGCTRAIA